MEETILLGRGRHITSIPRQHWEEHLAQAPQHAQSRLGFMSADHHRVRYFVVEELPRRGEPLPPEAIARRLQLPLDRVEAILADLEQHLFFLVRNAAGAVHWAFPVTVEPTAHALRFSTGEQLHAA